MKIFLKKTACAFLAALLLALPALLGGCGLFSDGNVYARVEEGLISADGFIYDLFENGDAEIVGINRNDIFPDTSTDGNGTTECHLVIPDTVDSHPVTSILGCLSRQHGADVPHARRQRQGDKAQRL